MYRGEGQIHNNDLVLSCPGNGACSSQKENGDLMDDMDVYMLICLFEKAFPGITCGECREAIDRLKDADIKVKIVPND